ncbi:MAG TPA: hypothetical protein VIW24_14470 [Aldersonia sp.]
MSGAAEDSSSALFAVLLYTLLLCTLLREDGLAPAEAVSRSRLWLLDVVTTTAAKPSLWSLVRKKALKSR